MSFMWDCQCGALNANKDQECQVCGRPNSGKGTTKGESGYACQDCQARLPGRELRPGPDDQLYRCGSCHILHLKKRAEGPDTVCFCGKTVRMHIDDANQHMREILQKSGLERPQPARPSPDEMREALQLLKGGKR